MEGVPVPVVHGHDLALGSGSVDGLLGTSLFFRQGDFYLTASGQVALRTRGSYGFRYGNSFYWNLNPGYTVVRSEGSLVGLGLNLSGESKGADDLMGAVDPATRSDVVFLGGQLMAATAEGFAAQLGLDLPISRRGPGLQMVPDYRVRLNLSWNL